MAKVSGFLRKMSVIYNEENSQIHYQLNLNGQDVLDLNSLVGKELQINFLNKKKCLHCKKNIRGKTYSQGYCYYCFISLPTTDMCMLKPELCHYHEGTCRDPNWGEKHCFQKHYLYLANSSELKVGISQSLPMRWVDQGAVEAVIIGHFPNRLAVGKAEKKLTQIMKDKTNWRNMLKGVINKIDLFKEAEKACDYLQIDFGKFLIKPKKSYKFNYPVESYPMKITSFKLDKMIFFKEILTGIKGQYLIFGNQVINLRSHGGYEVEFSY